LSGGRAIGAGCGLAQLETASNAKAKMQNSNSTHVRENGVKVTATFTPMLQTTPCLHVEVCILN
jgi:hypothetical protein